MKTTLLAALAFCLGTTAMSQTFHLYTRGVDYLLPASAMGEMTLCGTDSLQVLGQNFALSDIDSLTVDQATYTPRLVDVIYAGDRAQITADAALIPYLTITHKGAKVDIRQSDDVSDLTCGEITYRLSGVADDGGFAVTGDYKTTVVLAGLALTNGTGAAINVANGKRIKLKLTDGTTNSLTDGAGGTLSLTATGSGGKGIKGNAALEISGGNTSPGGGMGSSGGSSMLITCPGLTSGSFYTLAAGSSTSTVTASQSGSSGGMGRP